MDDKAHPTGLPLKAEQTFFDDPAVDRLLAMVMTLAAELHATKDRLAALESLLAASGTLDRAALDRFAPTAEQKAEFDAEREAFVHDLMSCALGREVSLGSPEEGVEMFNKD
jgi:hypothetical protein